MTIVGTSAFSAVVTGLFAYKKISADATKVLQELWHNELERLKARVTELENNKSASEAVIDTLKQQNSQLKLEVEELKCKYLDQVKENKKLHGVIDDLRSENDALDIRISKLEGMN